MSDKKEKALQAIARLKERADKGDPRAQKELLKLRENLAAQMAAPEVLGVLHREEEEESFFETDDLETADFMARKYDHADQLLLKAAQKRHKWQGLERVAPFVRDAPASALSAYLGGQQTITSYDRTLEPKVTEVAHWAGPDEESRAVTVTVGPIGPFDPNPVNGTGRAGPMGRVLFGTKNILLSADFDVGLGRQFTVTCSQIRLLLGVEDIDRTGDFQTTASGMLSFRATEKEVFLTRTKYINALTGGATSALVQVPNFAVNVTPFRSDNAQAITLNFINTRGTISYQVVVAAATQLLTPILLGGDIVRVSVTNAAGNTTNVELVFGLSL